MGGGNRTRREITLDESFALRRRRGVRALARKPKSRRAGKARRFAGEPVSAAGNDAAPFDDLLGASAAAPLEESATLGTLNGLDGGASWREIARFVGVSSNLETRLEQIFSLGAQGGATGPPPSSPSRPSPGDAARRLADLYRDSLRYVPRDGGRSQPSPGAAPDPILGGRVVPETFGLWNVDPDAVQKILDDLWEEKKAAVDERLRRLVVNMVALNGAATFAVVWLALKLFRRKEKE